jgi:hypothetical protein
MKALIITLITVLSINSWAQSSSLESLNSEQKIQLIQLLNELDGDALTALLTDEGLQWYISQIQRFDHVDPVGAEEQALFEVIHSGLDNGIDHFQDPYAPKWK